MTDLAPVLHLLRPQWLWALLALPLWLWLWRRSGQDAVWREAIDPHLRAHVLVSGGSARSRGPLAALIAAWILATLALAGPAWQYSEVPVFDTEAPLVLVLDLSQHQRATDLSPDRMTRTRFKLHQLLRERSAGQVGLLAYAADAYTVAPLTDDAATVDALIDALGPELMPADGQRTDRAIAQAAKLLAQAGFETGDILVLTDHADDRAIAAARNAREQGYRVSALGLGTEAGAPVPNSDGTFQRAADGSVRIARQQPDSLRALARAGDGRFAGLTIDTDDLTALDVLDPTASAASERTDASARQWRDDGAWLLLLVLPLVLFGFRRGGLAALVLCLPPTPALAFSWADLWQRPDQQADAALAQGDYDTARQVARDPARRGAAAYRAQDFDAAAEAWAEDDSATGHYNRGNALAQAGQLDAALDAYDRALALDPDFEDAGVNRAVVEQALQQRSQGDAGSDADGDQASGQTDPEQPGETQPGQGQPGDDEAQSGDGESEPGDAPGEPSDEGEPTDSPGDPSQPGEDGPGGPGNDAPEANPDAEQQAAAEQALKTAMEKALEDRAAAQAETGEPAPEDADGATVLGPDDIAEEERQRALEQWLRRVPDDPGGLLRRKFAIEHQRRLQSGENE